MMTENPNHAQSQGESVPDLTGRKYLADALRVSFSVLGGIMVIVLIAFCFTGAAIIEPQEKGIKTVFGRAVETIDSGLAITWPFPVGKIEKIDIKEQTLQLGDFWLHVKPTDVDKPKRAITTDSEGLKPGWDGALFTSDHSLLHVKLDCALVINDPLSVKSNLGDVDGIVRNVLASAAIRAAATRTAKGMLRERRQDFQDAVKLNVQRRLNILTVDRKKVARIKERLAAVLDEINSEKRASAGESLVKFNRALIHGRRDKQAREKFLRPIAPSVRPAAGGLLTALASEFDRDAIKIMRVLVVDMTWPIRTLGAYEDAQNAESERREMINRARGEANKILQDAAGGSYRKLVNAGEILGQPEKNIGNPASPSGLIGQYAALRKSGQNDKAGRLLEKIDDVLVSNETGGQVSKIIAEARTFRTNIEQHTAARVKDFNDKIEGFEKAPELVLERLWADSRDKILNQPTIEKFYITTGKEKTVLRISRDPDIKRQIERQIRKKKKQDEEGKE